MHAPGLVCSPLFRVHALIRSPRRVNFQPPASRKHCFCSAKWGGCIFQKIDYSQQRVFFVLFFFSKKAVSEFFLRFFLQLDKLVSFLVSGVLALDGALQEVQGRETLQNKGFRSHSAFLHLLNSVWTRSTALILHNSIENKFCGSHKCAFFFFSRKFKFLTKSGLEGENGFGLESCRFENAVFHIFPAKNQFVIFWRASCREWPCGCSVEGFCDFFRGCSFNTVFANLKTISSNSPPFLFVFYSFLRFLLGFGVNATLHVCFGGVGPKLFFVCVLTKTVFSPLKKGYFC